jgi:hypothetical protein
MTLRIDSDFVEGLIALYVIAGLCTGLIVVIWNVLKAVLKLMGWICLRAGGVKDWRNSAFAVKHAMPSG